MNWPLRSNQVVESGPPPSPSAVLAQYADDVPVNLEALVSDLGLGLKTEPMLDDISGMLSRDPRYPSGFCITVNLNDPPRRQRFTIAHEIAHYVLHRDLIGDGLIDNAMYRSKLSDEFERQADSLAAKILLPAEAVREAFRTTKSYAGLARLFEVSDAALRIRLKELRLQP